MTPHGKAHDRTHTQIPIFLAYFSYPDGDRWNVQLQSSSLRQSIERVSRDETGFARAGRASRHGRHADQVAQVPTGISLRCASEPAVRSTVLCCVGGVSWAGNQQHDEGSRRPRTTEHLFAAALIGARSEQVFRVCGPFPFASANQSLAPSRMRYGRSTPRLMLPSSSNARSATPGFSWTASASSTRNARTPSSARSSVSEYPRGVRYSPQGSLRKGRKHLGADDRSLAALSARLAFFSSGDGFGIHQPGSMTRGFASPRQPASGRARDRAMCPAVVRFNQGRAA